MNEKKILKKLSFVFVLFLLFVTFTLETVFAVSATLYGEVTDDGGDPNLIVWFEWGENSNLGNSTSKQTKYGKGEFSATLSDLKECKTYYYRAVVKHQNFDDTKYGEIKSFNTPCPSISVDIKANNSDGPIYLPQGSDVTLTWTSTNANYCEAFDGWTGKKSVSGSEIIKNVNSPKTFTLVCYGSSGSNSDSVKVYLQEKKFPSISKTARNVSDNQISFSDLVYADPGETIEFKITIVANSDFSNVTLKDLLPEKFIIQQETLKLNNQKISGNLQEGISLGNFKKDETKVITFLVNLKEKDQFPFGETSLINTATLHFNGESISDSAKIVVKKSAVLGTATQAPTGKNEKVVFEILGFLFSLFLLLSFLFKSYFFEIKQLLNFQQIELRKNLSEIILRKKISNLKNKKATREA